MAPVQFPQTFGSNVKLSIQTNKVNDVGHKYVKIYANTSRGARLTNRAGCTAALPSTSGLHFCVEKQTYSERN
jgi:hypothetical protein